MKMQFQAYFTEAKWLNQGYEPTFDEYLSNAMVSTGYSLLIATSFVGMGDVVTEEAFQWVLGRPKMSRASEIICRLMDDTVSHEVYIRFFYYLNSKGLLPILISTDY